MRTPYVAPVYCHARVEEERDPEGRLYVRLRRWFSLVDDPYATMIETPWPPYSSPPPPPDAFFVEDPKGPVAYRKGKDEDGNPEWIFEDVSDRKAGEAVDGVRMSPIGTGEPSPKVAVLFGIIYGRVDYSRLTDARP